MLVVSLVTILTMWKIPDANAQDRDYAKISGANSEAK